MCTLAIYFRVFADYPVIVAANRDEFASRPATAPMILSEDPQIIGGKDLKAGGTWLAINEHGLIAGLLNRRSEIPPDPAARSRGLLCLDALRCRTTDAALALIGSQRGSDYNGFNLLVATRDAAFVASNRAGTIGIESLSAGLHLLTNVDVDDFECPKISRSYRRFEELKDNLNFTRDPLAMRGVLAKLLSDHATQLDPRSGRPNALCLHLDAYGTRSSSLIFLSAGGEAKHFFAPGPPCSNPFESAIVPHHSSK